jgi:hypothetical protein
MKYYCRRRRLAFSFVSREKRSVDTSWQIGTSARTLAGSELHVATIKTTGKLLFNQLESEVLLSVSLNPFSRQLIICGF